MRIRAGLDLAAFRREEVAVRGLPATRTVTLIARARDLPDIPEPAAPNLESGGVRVP